MSAGRRYFGFLSSAWLVAGISLLLLVGLGLLLWSPWDRRTAAGTRPLRFYCANGAIRPVDLIIRQYQQESGVQVQPAYDGSGKLLSTIRAGGGQGDLYLAADAQHMVQAQKLGLVAEVIPVAVVHPVLIVNARTQAALQKQGKPVRAITDLLRDDLKVVLANPDLASIGQLTREVLRPTGVWAKLEQGLKDAAPRVSTVGTVNEVVLDVRTRDNHVGVVWSAVARQHDDLVIVEVPEFASVTEQMLLGVLAKSEQPAAALRFARYLSARNQGLEMFRKHYFETAADADVWPEKGETQLLLAAGAMLQPGVEATLKAFEQREGVKVNTSYAGCGHLVAQMKGLKMGGKSGTFPDAYLSCDTSFMTDVQPWFEKPVTLTENDIVLIVSKESPVRVTTLDDLKDLSLRVGLAHPTNSALGKLTDDLLKAHHLHDAIYAEGRKTPIVHTDAAHSLVSQLCVKALDAAVVYRSNALSNPANLANHYDVIDLKIPGALARQPYAVAKDSEHKQLARRLLQALIAESSFDRMRSIGFRVVYEP